MKEYPAYHKRDTLYMKNTEATLEEMFEYLYDSKKVKKWFNLFPITWFTVTGDSYDVNEITYFHFGPLPFKYGIRCKEILPDHRGMLVEMIGPLKGDGRLELVPDENGTTFVHELNLQGRNRFIHKYYGLIALGHHNYMVMRLKILRKMLIKEHNAKKTK